MHVWHMLCSHITYSVSTNRFCGCGVKYNIYSNFSYYCHGLSTFPLHWLPSSGWSPCCSSPDGNHTSSIYDQCTQLVLARLSTNLSQLSASRLFLSVLYLLTSFLCLLVGIWSPPTKPHQYNLS